MEVLTCCKSMQMASDLGSGLAQATNSLGSKLMTTLTGQSSAAAADEPATSQPSTNTTGSSSQTPEPAPGASGTAAATSEPQQTSKELYDTQVHPLQIPFLHLAHQFILRCTSRIQCSAYSN